MILFLTRIVRDIRGVAKHPIIINTDNIAQAEPSHNDRQGTTICLLNNNYVEVAEPLSALVGSDDPNSSSGTLTWVQPKR